MKKSVLLFAAVAALCLAACNKAELAENNLPVKQKIADKLVKQGDDWGVHEVWYDLLQKCAPPAINCFDEIIVTAPSPNVFSSYRNLAMNDGKSIVDFTKKNLAVLNTAFEAEDLKGVIGGTLVLSSLINEEGKTFFFFKGSIDGKIARVYPFIIK
jgi:hypothetical protein